MTQAQWMRLPVELRALPQWLLAGPNELGELKVPLSVDSTGRLYAGSSTKSSTWLDFDYALECAQEHGYGLGFVLADSDPFTCVDFDIKNAHNAPNTPDKWTPPEHVSRMVAMVEDLDSYTELSQSQQGVHVWVRGTFEGTGLKRMGVEVYCRERFIACTGRSIHNPDRAIEDRQSEVTQLVTTMRDSAQAAARAPVLLEGEDEVADEELMRRAWNADNAEKFRALWEGRWVELGYPSQSEADLSLMSMLTYYSGSNEQCRRLFRQCTLGQRDKAIKDDRYLNFTLRLIRGRQAKEAAAAAMVEAQAAQFMQKQVEQKAAAVDYARHLQGLPPLDPEAAHSAGAGAPVAPTAQVVGELGLPWPPGMAGALAQFIYSSSPRPGKEIAIVAALGFLAGVCGKAWYIPGSGLNLYMILVGRSGTGKEAMHTGLGLLMDRVQQGVPGAHAFISTTTYASAPALTKAFADWSSFCNVTSEFGKTLERMASDNNNDTIRQLRTLMTALYQKSGPASVVGGLAYSSKEKNVSSVSGVAYSMIGETTPQTLYDALTHEMMSDGFLSRFTIVEAVGRRPPANAHMLTAVPNDLAEACQQLCVQALTLLHNGNRCLVQRTQPAAELMNAFDVECDGEINATEDEARRQMWNRAHLKMMRLAALLAVADNPAAPVISDYHVTWALDLIRRDIAIMRNRIESGDVGTTDDSRERKIAALIQEFTDKPLPPSYGIPALMQRDCVVPRKYLQLRTGQLTAFNKHKLGARAALDQTLRSMVDSGFISEMDKVKAGEQYTFQGKCYRILQLPPH